MTTTEEHPEYMAGCVPPSAGKMVYNPPPAALHEQRMVEAARRMGIPVEDPAGNYTGLTHDVILDIFDQWSRFPETVKRLTDREKEIAEYRLTIGRLRWWMSQNTRVEGVADMDDTQVIETARALMETVKTVVASTLPVVRTIWGNIAHTLRQAGLIDHLDDRPTGDITLEDRVARRPK